MPVTNTRRETKKVSTCDLDALASPELVIKYGGKEYRVDVTVETMMKVDRIRKTDAGADQWELIETIMEEAGMAREAFRKLNARQATTLAENITRHFFPEAVAEVEKAGSQSNGPTPSPDSSATSAADTPSATS